MNFHPQKKNLSIFSFFNNRKGTGIVLWTEEQEQELQMLFEEYKDSDGQNTYLTVVYHYPLLYKNTT